MANIHFSRELGKRLRGTGVTTYSLHPGVIATELSRHAAESRNLLSYLFYFLFYNVGGSLLKSPWHGAQTSLYCCLDDSIKDVSGKYYSDCGEGAPSKFAQMEGERREALGLECETDRERGLEHVISTTID